MARRIIAIVAAGMLAGCGGSREASRDVAERTSAEELRRYEAEFRPSDHEGAPSERPRTTPAQPNNPSPNAQGEESEPELVPGYRVQIYSTTDIDAARSKRLEAEADFPAEWFYLQYDPPVYKIRAGNFLHRYEAERFAKLAVEKGFADSWAVPEKVFKQPGVPSH